MSSCEASIPGSATRKRSFMMASLRNGPEPIAETELILRPDGSLFHLGVKPEHVAPRVILVGDPDRVELISRLFDEVEVRLRHREFIVHTGRIGTRRFTVASSGIGVDNMDIVVNELDAAVNIDLHTRKPSERPVQLELVRIGTCGSLHPDIEAGSLVASEASFGFDGVPFSYDMQYTPDEQALHESLSETFPQLEKMGALYTAWCDSILMDRIGKDMHRGITATANGFYGPQGRSLRLRSSMENILPEYRSFSYRNLRITNFEMECSGLYALASLLGHRALTVCLVLASRSTKEFHSDPSASMERLIHQVIERF